MLALSVSTMKRSTLGSLSASFSSSGTKVMSVITTLSSAWLRIQAICSGNSRGLTVWQIAPMPMMPYQHSRWRAVFQAMVATRSPSLMPSRCSICETFSARLWISA